MDRGMSSFGSMVSVLALWKSKQRTRESIPALPAFSERNAELRVPHTPERREGLTPGHNAGYAGALHPGSGAGATTQRESTNGAGLTPRAEAQQNTPLQARLGKKIMCPKGAPYFQWSHPVNGSAREQI